MCTYVYIILPKDSSDVWRYKVLKCKLMSNLIDVESSLHK